MSGWMDRNRLRAALIAAGMALALTGASPPAHALKIDEVESPGGIKAWLVQDRSVPVIAIRFAFRGGSSQDPADKPGVAKMVSALLDEGAGPYDSQALHRELDDRAIEFRFTAERDYFYGTMRVLDEHRDGAFDLLRLMLSEPRFDPSAVERIRRQLHAALLRDLTRPGEVAGRAWWAAAFPGHPYAQPVDGTLESVRGITVDDLKDYRQRVFARDRLTVAMVGDITPEAAGKLLDQVFGGLPAEGQLKPVVDVALHGIGKRVVNEIDVPQTALVFGGTGMARSDPDFMAAYIVSHILGGGSFTSRLYEEVREKRGLAYSVYSSLLWLKHAAFTIGGTATSAERTDEVLTILDREIARMREAGPTAEELAKAKSFLKGSYALGLDTSTKIVSRLVQIQIDNLGIDYIERRDALIDAVTIEDARRAAERLFKGGILVSVAGRPKGPTSKMPGG